MFRDNLSVLKWDSRDSVDITRGNTAVSLDRNDFCGRKLRYILEDVPKDLRKRADDNADCIRWNSSYHIFCCRSVVSRTVIDRSRHFVYMKWWYYLRYFKISGIAFGYFFRRTNAENLSFLFEIEHVKNQETFDIVFSLFATSVQNWLSYCADWSQISCCIGSIHDHAVCPRWTFLRQQSAHIQSGHGCHCQGDVYRRAQNSN